MTLPGLCSPGEGDVFEVHQERDVSEKVRGRERVGKSERERDNRNQSKQLDLSISLLILFKACF